MSAARLVEVVLVLVPVCVAGADLNVVDATLRVEVVLGLVPDCVAGADLNVVDEAASGAADGIDSMHPANTIDNATKYASFTKLTSLMYYLHVPE